MKEFLVRWGQSARWRRWRYAFELLLERRLWLFVTADAMLVFIGLLDALLGSGSLAELYVGTVVVPMLLLGVPILSSIVSLERRAGSLDLALAVPSTERYFLRRAVPVCAFFIGQGLVLCLTICLIVWESRFFENLFSARGLGVAPIFVHCVEVGLLLGAVTLFWGSRLRSAGAAMAASFLTLVLLRRWVFTTPAFEGPGPRIDFWFGVLPPPVAILGWNLTVPALAAVLFYLYARERLRRAETMLA